jgi:hypothetical protein
MLRSLLIALSCWMLGGCATVVRGTTDQVQVISEPSGAEARTSIGNYCSSTPCTFEVARKTEFIVTISKEGYEPQDVPVKTQVSGAGGAGMAGNILLGGIVGIAADAATGATLDHYPNPVRVSLRPVVDEPAPISRRKRRPAAISSKPESVEQRSVPVS